MVSGTMSSVCLCSTEVPSVPPLGEGAVGVCGALLPGLVYGGLKGQEQVPTPFRFHYSLFQIFQ